MSEPQENIKKILELSRNKNPQRSDLSAYEFGKLPPQAKDLEEAVLGAVLIEKEALDQAVQILKPQSFYLDAHQKIFGAILKLYETQKPVDILTVTDQLRQQGILEEVGGPYYVVDLTNRVASGANVEYHARIIAQKYIQRELIRISSRIIKDAYEETTDVFELLDRAEKDLFSIASDILKKNGEEFSSSILNEIKAIEERVQMSKQGEVITGVGSGFHELDKVTAGWQPSDLVIVAARPGMGKTSYTLALARNASVMYGKAVAFFSLEMSTSQLTQRLISMETELSVEKFRKGNLEAYELQQLTNKIDALQRANIIIDDTPGLNIFELRAKARRLKSKYDIQLIIIDYLQLMSGMSSDGKSGGNREQEISQISRSLKSIAKELNIPVIALSQLSRAVETRGGVKKPQLSDLRESGAIEQDADQVQFLYRPEYYGLTEDEEGNDTRGLAEVIIAKHRNGALGSVFLKFIDRFAKFTNRDNQDYVQEYSPTARTTYNPSQDNVGYKTYSSKMNRSEEGNFSGGDGDDDIPF